MNTINSFIIRLYELLNLLNQTISMPLINLSKTLSIPILSVFLLGILGSTAPCQITSSLGAIGYLSKDPKNKKRIIMNTLWYMSGKQLVFLLYGLLITIFNVKLQQASIPIFKLTRKITGPLVILIGLYIINFINLKGSLGSSLSIRLERFMIRNNKFNSSFIIGIVFSLAFCPTLFWLFFGLVVPMSTKSYAGFLLPVVFALGTAIPMLITVSLLLLGKNSNTPSVKTIRKFRSFFKIFGGIILIIIGVIDTLIYWLK